MKAKYLITNPKFFLKHMESIGNVYYEGIIQFKENIRMTGIDPSRITLFEFIMGDDVLETTNKKKLLAPIDISDLNKILKRFKNPSELTLICDTDKQTIVIKGKVGNKSKTFNLSMITLETELFKVPSSLGKIEYNAVFRLNSNDLKEAAKDVEIYTEILSLKLKEDGLHVFANSPIGNVDTIIHMDVDTPVDDVASFSVKYVNNIVKDMKDTNLIVMLKSDHPLSIYDKLSDKSRILYYLAPRVEDENDWRVKLKMSLLRNRFNICR